MKKLIAGIASLFVVLTLGVNYVVAGSNPAITMSQAEIEARVAEMLEQAATRQNMAVNVYSLKYEAQIQEVMKLNGISREEAIKRIERSTAVVPKPLIGVFASYNPAENAFQQPLPKNFYAGFDKERNVEVFTIEKRLEVNPNYWYCMPGVRLIYSPEVSTCENMK